MEALAGFKRFPAWMWRNADVLDFIGWPHYLRRLPSRRHCKDRLLWTDLYSLHASIEAVLNYLDKVDPGGAGLAIATHVLKILVRILRNTAMPPDSG